MSYPELAVHTFTTRPWSMSECIEGYARRGIGGISVWRETLEGEDLCSVRKHICDAGLKGLALVRGGFFTGSSAEIRREAIEKNRECLKEAEALGLPQVVLVCGATPGQTARQNYEQIRDGIGVIAGEAELLDLVVGPKHQGQGIGKALLEWIVLQLPEFADRFFLEVRESNQSALALYQNVGFVEVGVRPKYYPADHGREDAILMAMELNL